MHTLVLSGMLLLTAVIVSYLISQGWLLGL